jgi:hypothetical protein
VLFITAVLLTGILLVVPPYLNENRTTSVVVYVRNSASNACAYLNTGVVVNGSEYTPLNTIIEADNYTYGGFQVAGISSTESAGGITVNVRIAYTSSGLPKESLQGNITAFIKNDLVSKTNIKVNNGKLYLNGKELEINVSVVRR